MLKVKIKLPTSVSGIGPVMAGLAVALGLHITVEVTSRADDTLTLLSTGETTTAYATPLRHPVILAMMRAFQHVQRAPTGLDLRVHSAVPSGCGLGESATMTAAGVLAANNLLGGPLNRHDALTLVARLADPPESAVAAVIGGVVVAARDAAGQLHHRGLRPPDVRLAVVLPLLPGYPAAPLPSTLAYDAAALTTARAPLFLDALQAADMPGLLALMHDNLRAPSLDQHVPGLLTAIETAAHSGVAATVCGTGPALLLLGTQPLATAVAAVERVFRRAEVPTRTWHVPLDTQGVTVSMSEGRVR